MLGRVTAAHTNGMQTGAMETVLAEPRLPQAEMFPFIVAGGLSLEVALAVDSWMLEEQRYHQADDPPAAQGPFSLSSPEHP